MSEARLGREADFHNKAFSENTRAAAGKFYAVASTSKAFYQGLVSGNCKNKKILEYGCGTGSYSFELVRQGASVIGIDISDAGVELANIKASEEKFDEQISFHVMDAESLEFEDNYFDLVCGSGILHHLNLEKSLTEVTRVLKPDGQAVFFEPLGHNPLINLYRRLTPKMRSEDERPLRFDDLHLIAQFFGCTQFYYFHLFSLMAVPLRRIPPVFRLLRGSLEAVDRLMFTIPIIRRQAWIVVMKLSQPRTNPLQI